MLSALLELLGINIASRFSRELERQRRRAVQSIRKTAFGALFLQTSGPFFFVGALLLLTAMLLTLGNRIGWVMATIWTGGASLLVGLLLVIIASGMMKESE